MQQLRIENCVLFANFLCVTNPNVTQWRLLEILPEQDQRGIWAFDFEVTGWRFLTNGEICKYQCRTLNAGFARDGVVHKLSVDYKRKECNNLMIHLAH